MDATTQKQLTEALTREHIEFDEEKEWVWVYTFLNTELRIAKEIAKDFELSFTQYLPIDTKHDKAGEYIIK